MPVTAHELPTWECFELLIGRRIGHLCLLDGGYPITIPVNYRVVTGAGAQPQLVVRTTPTSMVGRARGPCALEVDEIDLDHGRAWSVLARGTLVPVHGAHDLPDPVPVVGGSREQWMVVDVAVVSGRRFALGESDDGWSVDWQIA
jgi:hypothetical protein